MSNKEFPRAKVGEGDGKVRLPTLLSRGRSADGPDLRICRASWREDAAGCVRCGVVSPATMEECRAVTVAIDERVARGRRGLTTEGTEGTEKSEGARGGHLGEGDLRPAVGAGAEDGVGFVPTGQCVFFPNGEPGRKGYDEARAKCRGCFRRIHDVCVERTASMRERATAERAEDAERVAKEAKRMCEDGARIKGECLESAKRRAEAALVLFGKPLEKLGMRWRAICPPACLGRFGLHSDVGFCEGECWLREECRGAGVGGGEGSISNVEQGISKGQGD